MRLKVPLCPVGFTVRSPGSWLGGSWVSALLILLVGFAPSSRSCCDVWVLVVCFSQDLIHLLNSSAHKLPCLLRARPSRGCVSWLFLLLVLGVLVVWFFGLVVLWRTEKKMGSQHGAGLGFLSERKPCSRCVDAPVLGVHYRQHTARAEIGTHPLHNHTIPDQLNRERICWLSTHERAYETQALPVPQRRDVIFLYVPAPTYTFSKTVYH